MGQVSEEVLRELREMYPPGCRVELVHMEDPFVTIQPGTKGIVRLVDDIGTIHVNWDSGSSGRCFWRRSM